MSVVWQPGHKASKNRTSNSSSLIRFMFIICTQVRLLHMEGSCALRIVLAESDWSELTNQDNF